MKIKIINFPYKNYSYTQWLLLGFLFLKRDKVISIELPKFFKIKKKFMKIKGIQSDDYFFVFDVVNGSKKTRIVYDFSDTPFLFDENWLSNCDLYFKAQFPRELESGFFYVDGLFKYSYPSFVMSNIEKIKPSLIGIRSLGNSISFKKMESNYINTLKGSLVEKDNTDKFFIYFGSDEYNDKIFKDDYYDEGFFYSELSENKSHPNKFRGDIVKAFNEHKNSYCYLGNANIGEAISLNEYHSKLGSYKYNINVSGFRYSIPNRFMDSFITNTKILTDNLYVKWYVDFSDYVYQYGNVGYKKISSSNKKNIYEKIENSDNYFEKRDNNIKAFFNSYLSPKAFAKYILRHC